MKKKISVLLSVIMIFGMYTIPVFALEATPTSSTILVNGNPVKFDAYFIDGNNYFKLRDLAYVLTGTGAQFDVGWNGLANAISLTSGKPYTVVGGEMASGSLGTKTPTLSNSHVVKDGIEKQFTMYTINDNNYFKLRDIGAAFNFGVDWDAASNSVVIDTGKGYIAETKDNDISYVLINPSDEFVLKRVRAIDEVLEAQAVTEEHDPNGNLHKQGGYTSCIYMSNSNIVQDDVYGDDVIDKGTDCGGAVEVYESVEYAIKRNEYLATFDGTIADSGSHTVIGTVVVRTSDKLPASKQKTFEQKIISALTESEDAHIERQNQKNTLINRFESTNKNQIIDSKNEEYDFSTATGIEYYLTENYSSIDTSAGELHFTFSVIDDNDNENLPYDYDILVKYDYLEMFDVISDLGNYSDEHREEAKNQLKSFIKKLANDIMDNTDGKLLEGCYYYGRYKYPNLKMDWYTKNYCNWANYDYKSDNPKASSFRWCTSFDEEIW